MITTYLIGPVYTGLVQVQKDISQMCEQVLTISNILYITYYEGILTNDYNIYPIRLICIGTNAEALFLKCMVLHKSVYKQLIQLH